jgi:hypothetical protein
MDSYTPIGPELEGVPENFSLANMTPSFSEYFPAQAGNALRDSGLSSIYRAAELGFANSREMGTYDELGVFQPAGPTPARRVSADYAKSKAEAAGVKVEFGTSDYTEDAVDIMIDRARRRAVRDEIVSAYDPSAVTQLGISLAAGLVDPVNVASAFIPVVGEARYAGLLAGATSFGGRSAVRAIAGAAEGVVGAALLEPAIAGAATQEGRDYSFADTMRNLLFGAGFGAGLHVTGGAFAEKVLGRTYANAPAVVPEDIVDRLPQDAKDAAMRAAIADVTEGRPVQAADVIDQLTQEDPELANAVLYAQTLKRDGPEIDDTEARIAFWEGKLSGKRTKPAGKVEDFAAWVRSVGGLRDTDGALEGYLGKGHGLPSSLYITGRGAKRTARGVEFEDLYLRAVNEGVVTNKREFIDAFRAQAGGVIAPIVRRADSELADRVKEEADYIAQAIAQSGVNPKASAAVRARAIVGREQHVIAAERARVAGALNRLEQRRAEILAGAQTKPMPKEADKPAAEKLPTSEADTIEVGDTVETAAGEEFTFGGEKGARVTAVYDDPVYGKYVSVEGSNSAIEASRVKVKAKGEKPAETLSAAVEADKATVKAEATPLSVGRQKRKMTKGERVKAKQSADSYNYDTKFDAGRRIFDEQFPGLAAKGEYYYSAFMEMREILEIGLEGGAKWLRKAIKEGLIEVRDADTGKIVTTISSRYADIDSIRDVPDLIIKFNKPSSKPADQANNKTPPRAPHQVQGKKKVMPANLGPLSPEESAKVTAEAAKVGSARFVAETTEKAARSNKMTLTETARDADGVIDLDLMKGDTVVAKLNVTPLEAEKTIQLDLIRSATGKGKNTLGTAAMRELVDALAEMFPGYEKVTGFHMSGARGKAREAGGKPNTTVEVPLKKRSATEKAVAKADEDAAAMAAAGPAAPMPDSPPAVRDALTTKELKDLAAQNKALEQKTLKRLDSLIKTMSPETAATIRAQLAKIEGDSLELAKVYESAVQCLLKP